MEVQGASWLTHAANCFVIKISANFSALFVSGRLVSTKIASLPDSLGILNNSLNEQI